MKLDDFSLLDLQKIAFLKYLSPDETKNLKIQGAGAALPLDTPVWIPAQNNKIAIASLFLSVDLTATATSAIIEVQCLYNGNWQTVALIFSKSNSSTSEKFLFPNKINTDKADGVQSYIRLHIEKKGGGQLTLSTGDLINLTVVGAEKTIQFGE